MPFKSDAQRRKFEELVQKGKISKAEFDKWNSETKGKLPERVSKVHSTSPKSLLRRRHVKV